MWSAVQRDEFLPVELKDDGHCAAFRTWPCFAIAADVHDFRVLENRDIKVGGLFGLVIEPQERGDFWHVSWLLT